MEHPTGHACGHDITVHLHDDEEVFPNHYKLQPERWLDLETEGQRLLKYLVAFGAGIRTRVGRELGKAEFLNTIAMLFWRFGSKMRPFERMRKGDIDITVSIRRQAKRITLRWFSTKPSDFSDTSTMVDSPLEYFALLILDTRACQNHCYLDEPYLTIMGLIALFIHLDLLGRRPCSVCMAQLFVLKSYASRPDRESRARYSLRAHSSASRDTLLLPTLQFCLPQLRPTTSQTTHDLCRTQFDSPQVPHQRAYSGAVPIARQLQLRDRGASRLPPLSKYNFGHKYRGISDRSSILGHD